MSKDNELGPWSYIGLAAFFDPTLSLMAAFVYSGYKIAQGICRAVAASNDRRKRQAEQSRQERQQLQRQREKYAHEQRMAKIKAEKEAPPDPKDEAARLKEKLERDLRLAEMYTDPQMRELAQARARMEHDHAIARLMGHDD